MVKPQHTSQGRLEQTLCPENLIKFVDLYLKPDFGGIQREGDNVCQAGRHASGEDLDPHGGMHFRSCRAHHLGSEEGEARMQVQKDSVLKVTETLLPDMGTVPETSDF